MRSITVLTLAIILTLGFLSACLGQTAEVSVPKEGSYYYWFVYSDINGKQTTTTPRSFKEKKTSVSLPMVKDKPVKSTLYLLDASSGNEAIKTVEANPVQAPKISLEASSFNHARRVNVTVLSASDQLPAATGIVKLESDGQPVQTEVLDPSSQGTATFSDVATGSAKLTVEYGDGKATTSDIDIPAERKTPVASIKVPIVGDIETVKGAKGPVESEKSGSASEKESPSPRRGSRVGYGAAFIGMIMLVVLLYALYRILKGRGTTVQGALNQMGVLPDSGQPVPTSQPSGVQVDSSVCQFCGGRKDPTTGACSCSLGSGGQGIGGATTGPRLIATQGTHMGNIYPVGTTPITLGRAETNTVALPEDTTASRRHATVMGSGGNYIIRDEGSSNGTFVNGVKVTEQTLRPGDEIQVGSTRLRFEA